MLPVAAQGPSETAIPLLQLPHFDQDLLKRLARKQVRALPDLLVMSAADRREAYAFGGEPAGLAVALAASAFGRCSLL